MSKKKKLFKRIKSEGLFIHVVNTQWKLKSRHEGTLRFDFLYHPMEDIERNGSLNKKDKEIIKLFQRGN